MADLRRCTRTPCAVLLAVMLACAGLWWTGPDFAARAARATTDVNSLGLEAVYDVDATFNWATRDVEVHTEATVLGSKPWRSAQLAFNLSTLRTGHARLTGVAVNGVAVTATIDDQTLVVPMDPPLEPGASAVVEISYSARLNANPDPNSDDWGFARTSDLLTAYRWIPWLSHSTPFNRPSVGDPYVTASSPHVKVTLTSAPGLVYAATGVLESSAGGQRVFVASNVRDFNLSASPSYQRAQRTVRGTTIELFYHHLDPGSVLDVAERAFNEYSRLIGGYPYTRLSIGEIGPWAPLESPMLFWLPSNAPNRLLPWMTAHETAHQWFYSVVGNDQAREPFADEALSDYISRDLISRFVPSQCPEGELDQTIYDLGACYPWVIYVQGDAFLRDYRARIGSAAFWGDLAAYYKAYQFGLGGTPELLSALGAQRTSETRRRFPRFFVDPLPYLPLGALPVL